MQFAALYLARHNSIVIRIKNASAKKFEIIAENQVYGSGNQKPDLVVRRKTDCKIYIIDVTVLFDNRLAAFKVAADEREERYAALRDEVSNQQAAEVFPLSSEHWELGIRIMIISWRSFSAGCTPV